ncbi:MAG: hypothetical protein HKN87_11075 [Saprospiraceae bacterium]|nr:hypothetical protein [Saprospiraceae bacterium]
MRTRLVFWGKNEADEKVLIGLNLNENESTIDVYIFPESEITEDFASQMQDQWRSGKDILFPENHITEQRTLGITQSMLPDGYSVQREDILKRAQTEWHFVVLSSKLYRAYQNELDDLKEKLQKLEQFDPGFWEELKGFWSKVQTQVREKNLFRDHANKIRKGTDELFTEMKKLRKQLDAEFHELSEKHFAHFKEQLEAIDKKVQDGLSLQPIFQELKDLQKKFRDTKFTRDHRAQVWKKLDGLFKKVKKEKYGDESTGRMSPLERIKRRYDGLINAIAKMERSIGRDRKDLAFQKERIENTDGSLEAQLRAAKTKMIEERVESKGEKLEDMLRTRKQLEDKMELLEAREKERAAREEIKKAKADIKDKIAQDIKKAEEERSHDPDIQKAAEALLDDGKKKAGQIVESIEEGLEDVVDTIKAIAFVLEEKVDQVIEDLRGEEE